MVCANKHSVTGNIAAHTCRRAVCLCNAKIVTCKQHKLQATVTCDALCPRCAKGLIASQQMKGCLLTAAVNAK